MNPKKLVFSNLILLLVVVLVLLPFITSFQDILTRAIMRFELYRAFQDWIVPYELAVLAAILDFLEVPSRAGQSYVQYVKSGKVETIFLAWNCVGWQSMVFLLITLGGGLTGNFSRLSKFQTLLIGFLGTYLVNIFRLVAVVWIYARFELRAGIIFHDYFSNILSIVWLIVFWWVSYTFVLEEKNANNNANVKCANVCLYADKDANEKN